MPGAGRVGISVPDDVLDDYERVLDDVDLSSIAAREQVLRHDVKARIEEFNALAGTSMFKGMTSRDLTENVEQLQIRRSLDLCTPTVSRWWRGWPNGRSATAIWSWPAAVITSPRRPPRWARVRLGRRGDADRVDAAA